MNIIIIDNIFSVSSMSERRFPRLDLPVHFLTVLTMQGDWNYFTLKCGDDMKI